jgi:hypothetical protein
VKVGRIADFGFWIADCGFSEREGGREGLNIPQSAFRNPQSAAALLRRGCDEFLGAGGDRGPVAGF